jgi:hypothetical protein
VDKKTSFALFKWLKTAPTLDITRARLDLLENMFPASKHYVDFLWRGVWSWAVCVRTWRLTYGYEASSHQESIFATWKSSTGKNMLSLCEAPQQIYDVMTRREFRVAKQNAMPSKVLTKQALKTVATGAGCQCLFDIISVYCNAMGVNKVLTELASSATGYDCEEIYGDDVEDSLSYVINRRQSSGLRFKCLIVLENYLGSFFKVTNRFNRKYDIVALLPNGSVASSSSDYANNGIFGKHILRCFIAGLIPFNPCYHLHRVYWSDEVQYLDASARDKLTVFSNLASSERIAQVQVDGNTIWNYGEIKTDECWKEQGLGGEKFDGILHPTLNQIKCQPETEAEFDLKTWYFLKKVIATDPEQRQQFHAFAAKVEKDTAEKALMQVEGRKRANGLQTTTKKRPIKPAGSSRSIITVQIDGESKDLVAPPPLPATKKIKRFRANNK